MDLIERARNYVSIKNSHLFRPNKAKQPVIEHLEEVASLATAAECSKEAIAAAWLHDTVEDTDVTIEEIRNLFGDDVADIVDGLTDPPEFSDLPLEQRKKLQAERLKTKSTDIKLVKLGDQISNVRSVLNDPPIDWTTEKCLTYISGAKKIAKICEGLSDFLDKAFEETYQKALIKYKISADQKAENRHQCN